MTDNFDNIDNAENIENIDNESNEDNENIVSDEAETASNISEKISAIKENKESGKEKIIPDTTNTPDTIIIPSQKENKESNEIVKEKMIPDAVSYQKENRKNKESGKEKIIPDTIPYHIDFDLYKEAYKCYQKRFVFPKNRILQLIFLILAIDFGYHGIIDPTNRIAFVLLILCAAFIFILWYNPLRMRRSVMDVIREMDGDEYSFSMDSEKMTFRTVPAEYTQDVPDSEVDLQPPSHLYYTNELFVIEKYEFFLICRGKQAFYVLPKYALYDNQAEMIRNTLEEKIGKHFRCKF